MPFVAPSKLDTSTFSNNSTRNLTATPTTKLSPKSPLSGNPLKNDPELVNLIGKLDSINTFRRFRSWKASFVRKFETFLSQNGIQPAETSYQTYSKNMELYEKKVNQAMAMMEKGDLTPERTTVKGRKALNDMCNTTKEIIEETESLIPATNLDERQKKYNKYHLGAVLVREGFQEYDRMIRCNEKIQRMKQHQGLMDVADKQQLGTIAAYDRQIGTFRDVMHDLGLYEIMMKCRQFIGGETDEIILMDPKTGAIFELPREAVFEAGVLTMLNDSDGNEKIHEEETSRLEKEELIARLKAKFEL